MSESTHHKAAAIATHHRWWRGCGPTALALTSVLLAGSFCDETEQAGEGNLDRPGGVVAFTAGDAAYALIPLPQIRHIRAFSLSSYVFVPAPNLYFPLSIPAGPFTRRVAVDDAHGLAFVLDSADGAIRALRLGTAADPEAFTVVGNSIPVGLGPSGLAVDPETERPHLYVSSARSGEVIELDVDPDMEDAEIVRVFPGGARPADVALDGVGRTLIVADADSDSVTLLDLESGTDRAIDVGGPTGRVVVAEAAMAIDGGATIALVLRSDAPEIAILMPAADDPLVARVEIPDLPVDAAILASARHGVEVCTDLTEAVSCEYAAVITVSGRVYYVDLAATDDTGRPRPQVFDASADLPGTDGDPNALDDPGTPDEEKLYDPNSDEDGALARRPFVEVVPIDDFGDPPYIRQGERATYVFTYQGILVPLRDRQGRLDLEVGRFVDSQDDADLAGMGAQAGDLLLVPAQSGCADELVLPIVDADGARLELSGSADVLDCLTQSSGVRYSVRAGGEFTVAFDREDRATGVVGRVPFDAPYLGHTVTITLSRASDLLGRVLDPPDTGARLKVEVEDNFTPRGLSLSQYGALPTGVTLAKTTEASPSWKLLISAAGGSSLLLVRPGVQGSLTPPYLIPGVELYE